MNSVRYNLALHRRVFEVERFGHSHMGGRALPFAAQALFLMVRRLGEEAVTSDG